MLVTNSDHGASDVLAGVKAAFEKYWRQASRISQDEVEAYREAWKRKRPTLKNLGGKFGDPEKDKADDKGKNPLDVPILTMTWAEYFERVKSEKQTSYDHTMAGRLKVVQFAQRIFAEHKHFSVIDPLSRQKIAGLVEPTAEDDVDYRWFGSMKGAGKFWNVINSNNEHLSLALDLIPLTGAISRDIYLEYINRYRQAFPYGRHGLGTATRLLAMKRPILLCASMIGTSTGCARHSGSAATWVTRSTGTRLLLESWRRIGGVARPRQQVSNEMCGKRERPFSIHFFTLSS